MPLYVVRPPNPPPGVDWVDVVPGQYLYDVTGIYATLNTGSGLTFPFADSSGNGYDGTIHLNPPATAVQVVQRPGLVPGNASTRFGVTSTPANYAYGGVPGPINFDLGQSFTVEFLALAEAFAQDSLMCFFDSGALTVSIEILATGSIQMTRTLDFSAYRCVGPFLFDGNPHLIDVVLPWAGGFVVYVDGLPTALTFETPAGARTAGPVNGYGMFIGAGGPPLFETVDEFALYPFALTAGQVAARQAARGSFAAYSASVLADAPAAYYHLDEVAGTGRQVVLDVTDGTNLVEEIPSGFPAVVTPGPYNYSWQPKLNSADQSPGGTLTTVPLPRLVLPAGYTIGTRTLDLQPTDQWSDIAVWWDSDIMDSQQSITPYAYPPGALLVYKQIQG